MEDNEGVAKGTFSTPVTSMRPAESSARLLTESAVVKRERLPPARILPSDWRATAFTAPVPTLKVG